MEKQIINTIDQARRRVRDKLRTYGLDDADQEARHILSWVTGLTATELILQAQTPFTDGQAKQVDDIVARRLSGEPLDHIQGYREFYGRKFHINKDVLSPRQDTECVVDVCLSHIAPNHSQKILELGVGSGAILVTLLAERPNVTGIGTDISEAALGMTQKNAADLGVFDRVILFESDWYKSIKDQGPFDLIVSNPPYITDKAMTTLAPEVLDYDPQIALRGGDDGLMAYKQIIRRAPAFLKTDGYLIVEIGFDQALAVSQIFEDNRFQSISVHQDLAGQDRVISAQKA